VDVRVYLAQHGEAAGEQQDPSRALTERGRREVEAVAGAAARGGVEVRAIYHSGKLRARQTAELFAAALRPERPVLELAGLAPNDDPRIAFRSLGAMEFPVILVGHLPHLARLTALILTGDPEADLVGFRMGGLVALDVRGEGGGRVAWILTPELAGKP
jgi:phosphohistidine phosphatase